MKSQRSVNISLRGNKVKQISRKRDLNLSKASCILLFTEYVLVSDTGNNRLLKVSLSDEKVEEFGNLFEFSKPTGLANFNGKILVADTGNHRICSLSFDGKLCEVFAGSGICGDLPGDVKECRFNSPTGLCVRNEDILVSDTGNHRIKRIFESKVDLICGKTVGYEDGPCSHAKFNHPTSIIVDYNDLGFLLVDGGNHVVRKLSSDLKRVKTFAGSPSNHFLSILTSNGTKNVTRSVLKEECSFDKPGSIFMTKKGNVFICDTGNKCIKSIGINHPDVITNVTLLRTSDGMNSSKTAKPVRVDLERPVDIAMIGPERNRRTIILDNDRLIEICNVTPSKNIPNETSSRSNMHESSLHPSTTSHPQSQYEQVFEIVHRYDLQLSSIYKYYSEANRKGSTPIGLSLVNYIRFCRDYSLPKIEDTEAEVIDDTTGFEIIFKTIIGNSKCRMDVDDFLLSIVVIAEKLYFLRVAEYDLKDCDFESFFDRFLSKYVINNTQPQVLQNIRNSRTLRPNSSLYDSVLGDVDEEEEEGEIGVVKKIPREVKKIMSRYRDVFSKIFSYFSKTKLIRSELSSGEDMCSGFKSMNLEEFFQFLKDFEMIPHLLNFRKAIAMFERNFKLYEKSNTNKKRNSRLSMVVEDDDRESSGMMRKSIKGKCQYLTYHGFLHCLVEVSDLGFRKISIHSSMQLKTLSKRFKALCFHMNQSKGKVMFSDVFGSHMFRGLKNPFPNLGEDRPSSKLGGRGKVVRKIPGSSRFMIEKNISSLSTPEFKLRKRMLRSSRILSTNTRNSRVSPGKNKTKNSEISLSNVSNIELHPPKEQIVLASCTNASLLYLDGRVWKLMCPGTARVLSSGGSGKYDYEVVFLVKKNRPPSDEILKIMSDLESSEVYRVSLTHEIAKLNLNLEVDQDDDDDDDNNNSSNKEEGMVRNNSTFHKFPAGSFGIQHSSAIRFPSLDDAQPFVNVYRLITASSRHDFQVETEEKEEEERIEDLVSPISKKKEKIEHQKDDIPLGDESLRLDFDEDQSIMETMSNMMMSNNKKKKKSSPNNNVEEEEEQQKRKEGISEIDYFEKVLNIFMSQLMKNKPNLLDEVKRRITWAKEIFQYQIPLNMEALQQDFSKSTRITEDLSLQVPTPSDDGKSPTTDDGEEDDRSSQQLRREEISRKNRLLRAFVNLEPNLRFAYTSPYNYYLSLRKLMLEHEKFLSQVSIRDSLGSPILVKSNHFCCSLDATGGLYLPLEVRVNLIGEIFDHGNIQAVKVILPSGFDDEDFQDQMMARKKNKKKKKKFVDDDHDDDERSVLFDEKNGVFYIKFMIPQISFAREDCTVIMWKDVSGEKKPKNVFSRRHKKSKKKKKNGSNKIMVLERIVPVRLIMREKKKKKTVNRHHHHQRKNEEEKKKHTSVIRLRFAAMGNLENFSRNWKATMGEELKNIGFQFRPMKMFSVFHLSTT